MAHAKRLVICKDISLPCLMAIEPPIILGSELISCSNDVAKTACRKNKIIIQTIFKKS